MIRTLRLALILFFGVLGWFVAARLSSEAMAVVVGVAAGVLAGLPTAVLLMIAMRRFSSSGTAPSQPAYQQQPPVIVVNGGQQQPPPALPRDDYSLFGAPERRWQSVGYDDRPRAPVIIGDEDDAPPVRATTFAEVHPDLSESKSEPAAVESLFRSDTDIVRGFLADRCRQDGTWTGASELYEAYCTYAQAQEWQPATQQAFGAEMMNLNVPKRRSTAGFMYQIALTT